MGSSGINAGLKTTNFRGHLSGYGSVWFYPDGIANILSLSRVKDKYRVTFDSATDNCFRVHKNNGKILKLQEATKRLYYFDTVEREVEEVMLITTVNDNKSKISAYDFSKAKIARALQRRIGRPATKDYIHYVSTNQIPNCPITGHDIKNADFVWGPELGCLKGKTTRQPSPQIRVENHAVPYQVMQQYKEVTLAADVMKVTGIPFLMTISKHITFGTAGKLDNMNNSHIIKHFKAVIGAYVTRGVCVTIILADNQFKSMQGDLANLHAMLHITSRDEHVPKVERYNCTIKERVRANHTMLPFQHLPPVFIIEMIYSSVFWRNMFALKGGVSKTQSPSEIVLNRKLNYNAHCKVEFGEYVQTHEEHNNDMKSRTLGAIATRPSNDAGSYCFISLQTGRRINQRSWTSLLMPGAVVSQIHRLARRAKAAKKLTFTNNDNEDLDLLYADLERDEDDVELEHDDVQPAGVDDEDDDDQEDPDYDPSNDSGDNADDDDGDKGIAEHHDDEIPGVDDSDVDEETPGVDGETPGVDEETPGVDENENEEVEANEDEEVEEEAENNEEEEEKTTRASGSMNLRKQSRKRYDNKSLQNQSRTEYDFNIIEETESDEGVMMLQIYPNDAKAFDVDRATTDVEYQMMDEEYVYLTEDLGWKEGIKEECEEKERECDPKDVTKLSEYLFLTEQMGWKKGLKVLGEKGEEAIENELQQIHDMDGFTPKHWHQLTKEERVRALKYLMYLKEKKGWKSERQRMR